MSSYPVGANMKRLFDPQVFCSGSARPSYNRIPALTALLAVCEAFAAEHNVERVWLDQLLWYV